VHEECRTRNGFTPRALNAGGFHGDKDLRRGCWLGCAALAIGAFAFGVLGSHQMSRDLEPSRFIVHNLARDRFTVDFVTLDRAARGDDAGKTAPSPPIYYGRHLVKITFLDSNVLWLAYFETDAGWVADVDMYVSHVVGTRTAPVDCVTHERPAIMGRIEDEFSYKIDISHTSETSPAHLKGV